MCWVCTECLNYFWIIFSYSKHPLIRTPTGPKNLFEIANVRIIGWILKGNSRKGKLKPEEIFKGTLLQYIKSPSQRGLIIYLTKYVMDSFLHHCISTPTPIFSIPGVEQYFYESIFHDLIK